MEGNRLRASLCSLAFGLALLAEVAAPRALCAAAVLSVPHTNFTLPNGLKVILHEDHALPIVSANIWYRVGSGDEKPGRTGFAHLFEHMMFMGSQNVPTGDFDRLLEAAGADNNGSTNEDRTNYYEDGPSNSLPLMLYLDSDRMGFLTSEITAENVELQKGVVQNERRQSYENRPYGLAEENILKRLYPPEHPYHWPVIGSMADLQAASLGDVQGFFRSYYTPSNAVLVIAGDIDPAQTRRQVEHWFGDIARGPEVVRRPPPPVKLETDVFGVLEDRVQLPRVYDVWHSGRLFGPDDAALDVMSQILGGGKSSRLYRRLVYELQIANQVAVYNDAGRRDGKLVMFATATPGHALDELQRVIDEELARFAQTGPTGRELQRVKNGTEAQFLDGMQQVGGFTGKANQLNYYDYFAGTPDYFAQDLERYQKLTAADIQRVAREYVAGAYRVVLSVVPQGRTELAVAEGRKP